MPIYLENISHDELFASLKVKPIILNDLNSFGEEERSYLNELVLQTYTDDMVSMLPQCSCGELKGECYVGDICSTCHTPVVQSIESDITPNIWFRRPKNVQKLINPSIFFMLGYRFSKNKFNVIRYLTDKYYRTKEQGKIEPILQRMKEQGIVRGYNFFVENFDSIIEYLFSLPDFKPTKNLSNQVYMQNGEDPLRYVLTKYRHCIFSEHLPIPNRSLLVVEKNAFGTQVAEPIFDIKDAINVMFAIDNGDAELPLYSRENRTAKIIAILSEFYYNYYSSFMNGKPGLFRHNVYGTRCNYTFRAVIVSSSEPIAYDEIHAPWCVGVTVFRQHLLNYLLNPRDDTPPMTLNEAVGFLMSHVNVYHPRIEFLLNELIRQSKYKGIPIDQMRNPSLKQGSSQLLYLVKFKNDPLDETVGMSPLVCAASNAD
jgi:hypothetical protein